MTDTSAFPQVFARLKAILEPWADAVGVTTDTDDDYVLQGPPTAASMGRPAYFGEVRIRKNYVSFYLMPVYTFPEMLDSTSPGLRGRMQGKSCFNFTKVDDVLFADLSALTAEGISRYRKAGFIPRTQAR